MTSITTNPAAMQAARSLAATMSSLAATKARIESGLAVPTAEANPAIFVSPKACGRISQAGRRCARASASAARW
ncbi:hypothetical protein KO353_09125 [Elioraea tepida]|jgi:hypothetical protein|uniref:Uncharacterized protein n=1 Tax=Elioraea tepida TaxID=2843330 RepID=A0A975U1L9_9PROT|nr:hypothetical protein [Elioraea tepida]QXM23496.1 hypothetical protein KO353_09125 [Elioraea tepida]